MSDSSNTSQKSKKRARKITWAAHSLAAWAIAAALKRQRIEQINAHDRRARDEISLLYRRIAEWFEDYYRNRRVRPGLWKDPPDGERPPVHGLAALLDEARLSIKAAFWNLYCSPLSTSISAWELPVDELGARLYATLGGVRSFETNDRGALRAEDEANGHG